MDSLEKIGADFVKITDNTLSPELFELAVKNAHKRGFRVSGHIPFNLSATHLSKLGLTTVEHLSYLLKAGSPEETSIMEKTRSGQMDLAAANLRLYESFDPEYALAVFKELRSNHTAVVPTLVGNRIISYLDEDDHTGDDQLKYLGGEV